MLNEGPRILRDWLRDHATYGVDVLSPDVPRDVGDAAPPLLAGRVYDETRDSRVARGDVPQSLVENGVALVVRWGNVAHDAKTNLGAGTERWRVAPAAQLVVCAAMLESDTKVGVAGLYYLLRAAHDSALRLFDAAYVANRTRNLVRLELVSGDVQLAGTFRPGKDKVIAAAFALPVRVTFVVA